MARSLRWKLLAWYALMMGGLACVSGMLLYTNFRRAMERDIDGRLWGQAIGLSHVIEPAGQDRFEIELSENQWKNFREEGEGALHYAIWRRDGKTIDSSNPSLEIPRPRSQGSRHRGDYREVVLRGPGDTWVLVGQDIRSQHEQLRKLAVLTIGTTAAAVVLMLGGGWFLTGRALAPINRISQAAAAVSASNLSERIDASRMETELADLAHTINDAFDRLQRSFEQQTRFTADASHELRTPLAVVLSQSELALRQSRSEAEYRDMLDAIRRASQRMKGVVEGLLTLARADAGEVQLNGEGFDLREVVADTCRLLEPLARDEQITISQRLEPAPVFGDRNRLGEAIANILSNAIRYNQRGGIVDVTLKTEPEQVSLRIADTGPGIPDEERELIFDRFYRVDKARSRSIDGSGLGLAITKWIIDAHGGDIACRNGERGGTVFDVTLKRFHPDEAHDA